MPSLHVAWALLIAWAVIITSSNRLRWLVIAHPIVMTFAVVLTANHWWLDALAAGVLVVLAIWIDAPIQRWLKAREQLRLGGDDHGRGTDVGPEGDSQTDQVTVG